MMKSLEEANKCINGERQDDYGAPEYSFGMIAELWNTYLTSKLGVHLPLTPIDIAAMMILLKIARGQKKRDNWIDIIGYAAIAADRLSPHK